jgi:hypothetical protein
MNYRALSMLRKLLFEHPEEIGETYTEHAACALWIGLRMIGAGLACLVCAFARQVRRWITSPN